MDKLAAGLMDDWSCVSFAFDKSRGRLTDGKESPGDGSRTGSVTFCRGKGVGGRGSLEEYKGEDDGCFRPDTGFVRVGVYAKGFEERQNDEHNSPCVRQSVSAGVACTNARKYLTAMVERKRQVNK